MAVLLTAAALVTSLLVAAPAGAAGGRGAATYERAVVTQLNQARAARGLARVRVVDCADRVAESRVASSPRARFRARVSTWSSVSSCGSAAGAETAALRRGRPKAVVRGWLRSRVARKALLRRDVRWAGVGAAKRGGRWHVRLLLVAPPATTPGSASGDSGVMDSGETEILRLTNLERATEGLPALRSSACATSFAGAHTGDMVSKGSMFHADMRTLMGTCAAPRAAENVAWRTGAFDAAAVVAMWMGSPGHRANILDPRLTHLGVGVERDATTGRWYFTQDFLGLG